MLIALFIIVVGIVGIVSPDSVTTVRWRYFATPVGLYAASAVRVAMVLVLILVAPTSRAPRILEWEAMHTALLRIGAVVASATGCFVAFAVIAGRRLESRVG